MEKSVISSIIAVAVVVVLLTTVLIPMIDEASQSTVDVEANENPSWIRMSYYTGKLSDIVEVSYDSDYIIGTQRGSDDVIVYADSSSVIYSDNGTFWLYNSTTDMMLNSPFTIIVSGYVTTVDDGTMHTLPQHSWMYFPDPNGHCSTYYDVDFRTDTPIAAVSEQFAGMRCYNNIGGISMTVVKDRETVDDVYWGERNDQTLSQMGPEPMNMSPRAASVPMLGSSYNGNGTSSSPFYYWSGTAKEWDNQFYSVRTNPVYFYQGASINITSTYDDMGYEIASVWGNSSGLYVEHYSDLHGNANQTGDVYFKYSEFNPDDPGDRWDYDYHLIIVPLPTYTHTIYYNANGGSGSMGATTVTDTNGGNSNVTFAANGFTAPSHYHFVGWRINNTGTLYQPGNTYPVGANGSVTAYAQWEEDTRYNHTVAYNGNGATGGSTANTNVNDYNSGNTNVTLAANGFTKEHHTFTGWKINNAGTLYQPGQTVAVGGNATVTMYTQWLEDTKYTHTINYDMGTGTGGATTSTVVEDYNSGNTAVTFAQNGFTKEHYHFIGWDVSGTTYQPGATINVTGNGSVTATALWAEDTRYDHTIVYDAGTGSGTMSNTNVNDYNSGNTAVTLASNGFTKEHYHFAGWSVGGVIYQPGDTVNVAGGSSVTATAQWEEDTRYDHTIVYDANTGTGTMSNTVVNDYNSGNSNVAFAQNGFTKTDYHFIGWRVAGVDYQPGDTIAVAGDSSVTAYAQWEEDTRYNHTVIYNAGTGSGSMSDTVVTDYNSGNTAVTLAACTFTKTNWHFVGWLVGADTYQAGQTVNVIGNGSVTAVAQWDEDPRYTHTITYDAGIGSGTMSATVVTDYNSGNSNVTFASNGFTKEHYHFIGWLVGVDTYDPGDTIAIAGNSSVTAVAQWEEDTRYTHTIHYDANTGTGTMADTVVTDYNSGATAVTLAQCGFTKEHYHFYCWRYNYMNWQPGQTINITGNATAVVTAIWVEDTQYTHTIVYNANGGSGTMNNTSVTDYNPNGTSLTLSANGFTKLHYHFMGWSVNDATYDAGDTISVLGGSTVTAYAIWEEDTRYDHTVTYDMGAGTGGSTPDTVINDYNSGSTDVTLAQCGFTKEHYHFAGWDIGGSIYMPGQTVAVNGGSTITATAQWIEDTRYTHTILYSGNGNTGGVTASTIVTDYNSSASQVTFAECGYTKTNYHFIGWKLNNQGTLYQPGQTVLVSAGASVVAYAQWSEDPRYTHTVIYNANGGTGLMQNTIVTDYSSGESAVTLAACSYTKQYNTFAGWSVGGITYNAGDTVMVTGNSSVTATAVWEKIVYTSGDWRYTVENSYATLIQYDAVPNGTLVIPGTVDRYPVSMVGNGTPILTEGTSAWELDLTSAKAINNNAFSGYSHLYGTIVLSSGLTYIGHNAFSDIQGIADVISYLNDSAVIESDAFEDSSVSEVLDLGTMVIESDSFGLDATVKTNLEMAMCIGDYADSYTKVIGKGDVYDVLPIISLVLVAGILIAATGYLLYRRE